MSGGLVRARVEMRMEEGGFGAVDLDGAMIWGVLEIRTDLGDGVKGDGEATEDGGDEGDGAAEGLGNGGAVMEEDVVAVVAGNQATGSGGGWRMTEQLRISHHERK